MQKCSPNPNARWGFGRRSIRNANGSSKTSSSRFADAKYRASWSPARIGAPRSSQSSVAVRVKWLIGVTHRRISSTASGSSSGCSRSFSHSSGNREKARSPPLIAFRVVSLPASTRSSQYDEQLRLGERLAVDATRQQLAHEVVARLGPALRDQLLEVRVQLAARAADGVPRLLAVTAVLGVVVADDLVGPTGQQRPIGFGHPEDQCDHAERHRCRDPLDEVALGGTLAGRGAVEHLRPRCARCRRGPPAPSAG